MGEHGSMVHIHEGSRLGDGVLGNTNWAKGSRVETVECDESVRARLSDDFSARSRSKQ